MSRPQDEEFMNRALDLAERGEGRVEPNPMVGCVIVRGGRVVAEGWHQKYGGPHAEIEALAAAEAMGIGDLSDAEMYVTLEPCCHHGKTPACTDAIIRAKPKRVIAATIDPFAAVAGKGISILRQAGIETIVGVGEAQSRELLSPFIKRVTRGLPWVIGKWAQTLDGCVATASGDSKWISNEWSRAIVHEMRGRVDAVMVGVGTVLADNPLLTARPEDKGRILRSARRVVIDPTLRMPLESKLLHDQGPPVSVVVDAAAMRGREDDPVLRRVHETGGEVIKLQRPDSGGAGGTGGGEEKPLNLLALMEHLASAHSVTNVLIEGGATLMSIAMEQGLIDELMVFVAPKLLGDRTALGAIQGLSKSTMAEARTLQLRGMEQVGQDVMLRYRV